MWKLLVTLTKNDTGDKSKNQKSTLSAFKTKRGEKKCRQQLNWKGMWVKRVSFLFLLNMDKFCVMGMVQLIIQKIKGIITRAMS